MLFINAVNEVAREQAQSFLRDITSEAKILAAYRSVRGGGGFAAVATTRPDRREADTASLFRLYVAGARQQTPVTDSTPRVSRRLARRRNRS